MKPARTPPGRGAPGPAGGPTDRGPAGPAAARADRAAPWLLLAGAVAYAAWFWSDPIGEGAWSPHGPEMIQPGNSTSFLEFGEPRWATRWAGYPMFLDAAGRLFGGLAAVPRVQLLLAAGSVWFLGSAARRVFRSPGFALLLAGGLFAVSAGVRFHAYILSEALFVPLATAMLGALLLFARRPTALPLLAASALGGLAVTARPAGALVLLVWPVAAWLFRRRTSGRRLRFAAAAALPLAACFLGETAAWNRAYPGLPDRPSIVDRHLFAKALVIPSGAPETGDPEWDAFFREARGRAAPLRRAVAEAPGFSLRSILLRRVEHALQHPTYLRLFRGPAEELAERGGVPASARLGQSGLAALLGAPSEWAANAAIHFVGLWTLPTLHTARFAGELSAYAEDLPGRRIAREARLAAPISGSRRAPPGVAALVRLAGAASFAACLAALFLAVRHRIRGGAAEPDLRLCGAALAAVMALGYFLVTAALNFSSLRYSAAMWPFLWVCAAEIGRRAFLGARRGAHRRRLRAEDSALPLPGRKT